MFESKKHITSSPHQPLYHHHLLILTSKANKQSSSKQHNHINVIIFIHLFCVNICLLFLFILITHLVVAAFFHHQFLLHFVHLFIFFLFLVVVWSNVCSHVGFMWKWKRILISFQIFIYLWFHAEIKRTRQSNVKWNWVNDTIINETLSRVY